MNVLVYSHVPLWVEFHAESVEFCLRHLQQGDNVFLLSCDGSLTSCPANPFHNLENCGRCRRQTQWTIKRILNDQVVDIRLPTNSSTLNLPQFSSLDNLYEYIVDNVPFGELVISQLVNDNRDCCFPLSEYQERVHELLSSAIHLYSFTQDVIKENHIDLVYVWNGRRCSDGPVSYAALNLGIQLITHICARKPKHFIQSQLPKIHALDFQKEDLKNTISNKLSIEDHKLVEKQAYTFYQSLRYGTASFLGSANFSSKFSQSTQIDPLSTEKPTLVIFTSSFWEYYGMSDWKGGTYHNHYDGLEQILSDRRIIERWNCVVRWHPNLSTAGFYERERISNIIKNYSDNVAHYPPSSNVNSYSLIECSDVVITFGSTIGIEASFMGKPSILLGRSVYEDLNACYVPNTHSELIELLSSVPQPKYNQVLYASYYAYYLMNETSAEMEFVSYRHKGFSSYFVNKVRLMEPFLWIRLAAFNYAKSNAFLSMLIDFYKFCIKLPSILFHSYSRRRILKNQN